MSNVIYQKKGYLILGVGNGYIVYNSCKKFSEGHTHLKSFKASKSLIYFALNKRIPKTSGNYYLESLYRITDDTDFAEKIRQLIEVRRDKGRKVDYYNVNKRGRN